MSDLTDNQALNQIAVDVTAIRDLLYVGYTDIISTGVLSNAASRVANAAAVRTVILNLGPNDVLVKEDGIDVMIVQAFDSRKMPVPGRGLIQASFIPTGSGESGGGGGGSADIVISTYLNQIS